MPVVLVVEDDSDIRDAIADVLRVDGVEVLTASDGVEALDAIYGTPKPDVILLDLMMPDVNGWEFVKIKNKSPELRGIPIIVLTAMDSQIARAGGLEGTQMLIHKPFELHQLLRAIHVLTKDKGSCSQE